MTNEIEDIRRRLGFEQASPVRYTFFQKLRSFMYHVGIVTFGPIICRDRYNNYMSVFDEFIQSKK